MGTWSYPNTVEKAEKLTRLMSGPIPQKYAKGWLDDIMGDEDLMDDVAVCDPELDVRPLIKNYLKMWLTYLDDLCRDGIFKPWEPEAIELCQKLVAD